MTTAGARPVLRAWGALFTLLLFASLLIALAVVDAWRGMGQGATGERLQRMQRSAQWKDGAFENPQPLQNDFWGMLGGMFHASAHTSPEHGLDVAPIHPDVFATPPPSGLRVTWFGHASTLVEIDGVRVLTDPVWSERTSPVTWAGPQRWFAPPIAIADLPVIDAVVISHDHYDHLDMQTLLALHQKGTTFVVPLGVGAHLEYWGIPVSRIVELDWWERTQLNGMEIVCTPARHASGRSMFDKDSTLWAGYALITGQHRVFFSGDTGLFPAMRTIGEELGPFDLTMIETGQYHRAWPDWHIGPEQAVIAHQMLRGRLMLPLHWGLFALAYHGWTEPAERTLRAAADQRVTLVAPKPGQPIEPTEAPIATKWWPAVPWETAEEHPIVSSQMQ